MMPKLVTGSLLLVLSLAACDATPVDPEGTLDRVSGGTMIVGVTASDPWVVLGESGPTGVEVTLVERFAETISAKIEWVEGPEEDLFSALKYGEIDLLIGGLSSRNSFGSEAALIHTYLTTQVVVALPENESLPEDLAGLEVEAEKGTEAAGILAKTDAEVILVDDTTASEGLRAIDDYLLDDLGLRDTGDTLLETDHVMAVRLGENGFMVTLERFLLENSDFVHDVLDAEAKP